MKFFLEGGRPGYTLPSPVSHATTTSEEITKPETGDSTANQPTLSVFSSPCIFVFLWLGVHEMK